MNRIKRRRDAPRTNRRGTRSRRSAYRAPTVRDVSAAADVSVGTVSHVLSNARNVSPETRARVQRAMKRLGYKPNRIAQSLIRRRTMAVGMVIPDVANPFFAELARGAEDVLAGADYALVFGNSDNDAHKERRYIDSFKERQVDGMIVAIASDAESKAILEFAKQTAMVLVDRAFKDWSGDTVLGDNSLGMGLAVNHLVELGHRRIGLVNGDPELSTAKQRRAGFERSLHRHGLEARLIREGRFTLDSGQEQTRDMLALPEPPTAICAANDLLALGALLAAAERNVKVPAELSVVGYDDIAYARLAQPRLTTISQPAYEMGAAAARLLLQRLASPGRRSEHQVVAPRLVVRDSTVGLR
jgi:LacI family transcriptional regulator